MSSFWCKKGKGEVITQSREIEAFKSIDLRGNGTILISRGENVSLDIETFENLFEYINTHVEGDRLVISTRRALCPDKLNFHITMPELENLVINGSGDVFTRDVMPGDNIRFAINGSGDVRAEVESKGVGIEIDGSGDVRIKGKTTKLLCQINGSGDVNCSQLESERAKVDINGSGDCKVFAKEYLKVGIFGSGDVGYRGAPRIEQDISGSGDIHQLK
ncbi:MAG: head GIN domain-containing protein [Candidatus Kapaibacterium sp.]